jgi:hypothetical protein
MIRVAFAFLACALGPALAGCDRPPEPGFPEKAARAPQPPGKPEAGKPEDFKSAVVAPGAKLEAPGDQALGRKVKSALETAPDLNAQGVDVSAADGVVTLYGTVEAPAEKERAALLALQVDGVRSVINNLVVVTGS